MDRFRWEGVGVWEGPIPKVERGALAYRRRVLALLARVGGLDWRSEATIGRSLWLIAADVDGVALRDALFLQPGWTLDGEPLTAARMDEIELDLDHDRASECWGCLVAAWAASGFLGPLRSASPDGGKTTGSAGDTPSPTH